MNVLVTGATGLVGKYLLRALSARGDHIFAHARKPQPGRLATTWFYGDASQAATFVEPLAKADAIINLAGAPIAQRWTDKARRSILQSRVLTTRALGEALRSATPKPRTWVNASAVGFYGQSGEQLCDEATPSGEGFLSEVCQAWEGAATAGCQGNERLVLLRLGVVFAQDGGALQNLARVTRAFLGGPVGDGQQWMSWVHIQDVVRMALWALDDNSICGPLNVTAPNAARQADVAARLAHVLSRPSAVRLPAGVLRWALGAMAEELVLGGQNVVPKKALAAGYQHAYPGLDGALKSLLATGT